MTYNGLIVSQNRQLYTVYTPNGIVIAQIYMGDDNQFMLDAECIRLITKVLARRWNIQGYKK